MSDKIIVFQKIGGTRYNLSFGDFKNGRIDGEVVTNNGDLVKVISTVAQSVYLFLNTTLMQVSKLKVWTTNESDCTALFSKEGKQKLICILT